MLYDWNLKCHIAVDGNPYLRVIVRRSSSILLILRKSDRVTWHSCRPVLPFRVVDAPARCGQYEDGTETVDVKDKPLNAVQGEVKLSCVDLCPLKRSTVDFTNSQSVVSANEIRKRSVLAYMALRTTSHAEEYGVNDGTRSPSGHAKQVIEAKCHVARVYRGGGWTPHRTT